LTDPFTPKIVSSIKLRVSSVLDVRGSQSKETHEHHSRPLLHGNKKVEPAYMGGDYFFDHLPCVQEPSEKVTGLYLIGFIETCYPVRVTVAMLTMVFSLKNENNNIISVILVFSVML
jgi:hypothetical protein